jgi:cell division protein FtsL
MEKGTEMIEYLLLIVGLLILLILPATFFFVAYQNEKLLNECEELIEENRKNLNEMKEI